jgi:membrane-associated phospholipid phosphatase
MIKNVLYDWLGYNKILLECLNSFTNNVSLLKTFKFITEYIGDYMMFPVHICLLFIFFYTFIHKEGASIEKEIKYIKATAVLVTSLMLMMTAGQVAKIYFAYVRPYCSPEIQINPIVKSIMGDEYILSKCLRSFPSGHTQYITIFTLSMWNVLKTPLKALSIASIIAVGSSRIILGAHFPADVFYGIVLGISFVTLTRFVIKNTLLKLTLTKIKESLDF